MIKERKAEAETLNRKVLSPAGKGGRAKRKHRHVLWEHRLDKKPLKTRASLFKEVKMKVDKLQMSHD